MKTLNEAQTELKNIIENGFVVVDSKGNEWITPNIYDEDEFIWVNQNIDRRDWCMVETPEIKQETLRVPDESGNYDKLVCRYMMNKDVLTPYDESDIAIIDLSCGYIIAKS